MDFRLQPVLTTKFCIQKSGCLISALVSQPDIVCRTNYMLLMLLSFIIFPFLTVRLPLEINNLKMYWTDLHQIFRICTFMGVFFFSRSLKGRCYGNRFLARIDGNWHAQPLFCVLALHNGWEDRNVDALVNTADDPSMSD